MWDEPAFPAARSLRLPLVLVGALAAGGASPRPSAPPTAPSARPTIPPATPVPTATAVPPGEVRVSVWLKGSDGKRTAGQGAVVWIPGSSAPAAVNRSRVASLGKRFQPRVAAVPVGGTVEFPNLDRIYHNVFSLSERAKFDLGLYRNGASKDHRFASPGLVRIYCNIHPQMAAFLMVVDGQNVAIAGADGVALLGGVPPGAHPLRVWEERGGEWAGTAEVSPGKTTPVAVSLDTRGFREVAHTRKDGSAYPPPDDDENRY